MFNLYFTIPPWEGWVWPVPPVALRDHSWGCENAHQACPRFLDLQEAVEVFGWKGPRQKQIQNKQSGGTIAKDEGNGTLHGVQQKDRTNRNKGMDLEAPGERTKRIASIEKPQVNLQAVDHDPAN